MSSIELLRSLFAQQKGLRSRFEIQKAAEWEELTVNLQSQIDKEIVELRQQKKLTYAELGRMMNTSDFRTAQTRVSDAELRVSKNNAPTTVNVEASFVWAQDEDGLWLVSDGVGHSAKIIVLEEDQTTVVKSGDPAITSVFTSSPEMGYVLWTQREAA